MYTSALTQTVSAVMRRVYLMMTAGLVVTGLVSLLMVSSPAALMFIATHSSVMWIGLIVSILLVIGIQASLTKYSPAVAATLFFVLAAVYGVVLSPIFAIYTGASIAKTFFIAAGVFAAMSIYGYFTSQDLTRIGSFLFMALIGLIIASLVNMFFHSNTADIVISFVGVLVFIGLTAWDTQQIKNMAQMMPQAGLTRLATMGALSLYLDFINIFLYLLRFFGNRD